LTKLAQASGIETPTHTDLARIDPTRKKQGSNSDWTHPDDADAKITKMKDGHIWPIKRSMRSILRQARSSA
jgi:transposase